MVYTGGPVVGMCICTPWAGIPVLKFGVVRAGRSSRSCLKWQGLSTAETWRYCCVVLEHGSIEPSVVLIKHQFVLSSNNLCQRRKSTPRRVDGMSVVTTSAVNCLPCSVIFTDLRLKVWTGEPFAAVNCGVGPRLALSAAVAGMRLTAAPQSTKKRVFVSLSVIYTMQYAHIPTLLTQCSHNCCN